MSFEYNLNLVSIMNWIKSNLKRYKGFPFIFIIFYITVYTTNFSSINTITRYDQNHKHLYDLGFNLIPEISSSWHDYLVFLCIFLFTLRWIFVNVELVNKILIYMSITYILRLISINLTILPPIGDCNHVYADSPYRSVFIYDSSTCFDYIYSGHISWMIFIVLLSYYNKHSKLEIIFYLLSLFMVGYLIIATRSHYSVDIYLGTLISTLVFHVMDEKINKL
jgi:hypothetical protein